jgi:hypothetical protein
MHDVIALGAPRNCRDLDAWTPERGQRLGQFEFASRKGRYLSR